MASNRSESNAVEPPPRTLNVKKFAGSRGPELESLHAIVSNRLNGDFRSRRSKRRRTTGHDDRIAKNRSRKRRKLAKVDSGGASISKEGEKKVSRRIRRRIELSRNPETGFCVSGDGTKRLRTHVWHAKRFEMTKRWGFYLPLGLQGRGRGSRSVLKWLRSGALIHDASYYSPVQLEGPEESLLKILRMVLVPPPSSFSEKASKSVVSGDCYTSAMLHYVGAPFSQLIAPVTLMWRPSLRDHVDLDDDNDSISNGLCMSEKSDCNTSFQQLWVWIHAAAFSEGFSALRDACQKLMDEIGVSVNCFSREGQLAKLELVGSKAIQVLKKTLHPVAEEFSTHEDFQLRKCSVLKAEERSQLQNKLIFEHVDQLPSHAIVSLTVHDPRDIPVKAVEKIPEATSTSMEGNLGEEDDSKEHTSLKSEVPNGSSEVTSSLLLKPNVRSVHFSDSKDLWTANDQLNPPMEENRLCMEKHQRRLAFFYLDRKDTGASPSELQERTARCCPILLLKNINDQRGSCIGWSIILPISWVKAFWIPLISHGARAIGLRERQWVACDGKVPAFPSDFPDCESYSCFMSAEATAYDQKAVLRPPAVRPLRVPIPPPWDCVIDSLEEGSASMEDNQKVDMQTQNMGMVYESSSANLDRENCHLTSSEQGSFPGFIARTSNILSIYLKEICCLHLPLFPNTMMGKRDFPELMKENMLSWVLQRDNQIPANQKLCFLRVKRGSQIPANQKLCFLRVLLNAYKEGVFEEGAVICAPILADLSLWTRRSDEQDRLQIPQSLIKSYFIQKQSGNWELQVPEDPVARKSHRWPIGFVTTGFVRGSAKPVAVAFCEATLLAQLRWEQWNEMQEKGRPEIFVLVRNLKAAAYRLALATIVVEQQAEDMEFM